MAYVNSNSRLPQNSMDPLPVREAARSAECIRQAQYAAATGRIAAYSTVPAIGSFDSPALQVDAAKILNQSDLARRTILMGGGPDSGNAGRNASIRDMIAGAPEVLPLHGGPIGCSTVTVRTPPPPRPTIIMPDPAPVPVLIPRVPTPAGPVTPQMPPPPPQIQIQRVQEYHYPDAELYVEPPPAPPYTPVQQAADVSLWDKQPITWGPGVAPVETPPSGLRFEDGGMRYEGYAGYAPPWGNALLTPDAADSVGVAGWVKGLFGLGALAILGTVVVGGTKRRRYGK